MLTLSSNSRHTVNGTDSESFVSVLQELQTTKYIKLWSFPTTKSKSKKGRLVFRIFKFMIWNMPCYLIC